MRSGRARRTALAFTNPNTAGNLIIVYAIWSNTGTATVTDSRGDAYVSAAPRTTWGSNWSSQVFVAKNIAGGANTVTATFATAINSFAVIYIHEYAGLDKANPVDVTKSATGSASAMSSGAVTTTNATDLIFAGGASKAHRHQGRHRLHHPLDCLRQPHRGPHRHDRRLVHRDRDPEQQRLGDAARGAAGRSRYARHDPAECSDRADRAPPSRARK